MRNFGAALTQKQIIDAVTCQGDTAAQVNSYAQILPQQNYPETVAAAQGDFIIYDTAVNKYQRIQERVGGFTGWQAQSYELLANGAQDREITNHWKDVITFQSAGVTSPEFAYNPTSRDVHYSLIRREVEPNLLPFYSGDPYAPTVKKLMEADRARAMSIRANLVKDFSVKLAQEGLDAYRQVLSSGLKSGMSQEQIQANAENAAQEATNTDKNDVYSNTTTGEGEGNGEEESTILPKVLTMVAFAGIGFGAAWLRGRMKNG
jgi:hypothetical protein